MVVNLLLENVKRMVLVVHVLRLFVIAAILCNMEVKFLVIWHQCRRDYRSIVKTEIKKSLLLLSELSGLNCRVITDTLKTLIKMNTLMLFTDSCLPHNQIDNFLTNWHVQHSALICKIITASILKWNFHITFVQKKKFSKFSKCTQI